jgi:two-component system, chemotaxis family, CheB/CheR fusion protein
MRRDIRIALARGEIIERNVRRRDGQAHYLMRILPYRGIDAVIEGVLVIFVDVTRIVQSETHQLALVDELSHRVRGMLGSMSAIATITLPRSVASAAFVETFTGRIDAMGAAYALIAEADGHAVALRDIVQAQARAAGLQGADRMAIEGASISFKPTWALALGLVLHELATNAIRHGALAKTDGRVLLTSAVEAGEAPAVVLRWREAGGAGAKKPVKKGFGMELIERELHAIGGTIKFSYVRSGFGATLSLPFDGNHVLVGAP